MSLISEILDYNQGFVERKDYEAFQTDRFPNKKLVILTCMDTRLTELLPRAMDFRNGDVKMIKNAGGIVSHPFGSVMRSILIAVYELQADEIAVIGHHNCAMAGLSCERILEKAIQRGIPPATLSMLQNSGIDLPQWLRGFDHVENGIASSIAMIRNHPLLPPGIPVHGLIMHPETGKLDWLINGYDAVNSPPALHGVS
jgi:carbonic anhydrase